jgi:hypothetical protein
VHAIPRTLRRRRTRVPFPSPHATATSSLPSRTRPLPHPRRPSRFQSDREAGWTAGSRPNGDERCPPQVHHADLASPPPRSHGKEPNQTPSRRSHGGRGRDPPAVPRPRAPPAGGRLLDFLPAAASAARRAAEREVPRRRGRGGRGREGVAGVAVRAGAAAARDGVGPRAVHRGGEAGGGGRRGGREEAAWGGGGGRVRARRRRAAGAVHGAQQRGPRGSRPSSLVTNKAASFCYLLSGKINLFPCLKSSSRQCQSRPARIGLIQIASSNWNWENECFADAVGKPTNNIIMRI